MHIRAQIDCYELKGDLSPVMLKEIIISQQFENFEIYKDLYYSSVTEWEKLFFSYKSF